MSADIINAFLNGYGDVDVTSLVQDLGLTSVPFFGTSADITGVTVDLGGLLGGGGSLFDSIGIGLDTDLGDLDLSASRSDRSRRWSRWANPSPKRSAGTASAIRSPAWPTSEPARPTRAPGH